jgi:hypothetical protein
LLLLQRFTTSQTSDYLHFAILKGALGVLLSHIVHSVVAVVLRVDCSVELADLEFGVLCTAQQNESGWGDELLVCGGAAGNWCCCDSSEGVVSARIEDREVLVVGVCVKMKILEFSPEKHPER